MPQLIPPVGEARDDYAILSGLADRLGAGPAFTEGRSAADWIAVPLRRVSPAGGGGRHRGAGPRRAAGTELAPPADPGARPEPDALRALPRGPGGGAAEDAVGQDRDLLRDDRRLRLRRLPRPSGLDAAARMARRARRPPRRCTSFRRNPATSCTASSRARSRTCRARVRRRLVLHPDDAAARGIGDGDLVRVFNARGACRARARVSDGIRPGVVALPTGAWFGDPGGNLDPHGNPNVLTLDVGTSRLGAGLQRAHGSRGGGAARRLIPTATASDSRGGFPKAAISESLCPGRRRQGCRERSRSHDGT